MDSESWRQYQIEFFSLRRKNKIGTLSNICSDLNYYHKIKCSYQLNLHIVTWRWQQKTKKL